MFQEPIIITERPWFPPALKARLQQEGRVEFTARFSRADKKVMRKHRPIPVSQWAEKHRIVTMSRLPGPWRNEITPYLAGLMDAAAFPSVETIIICKGPQGGSSEAAHNFIGYAIDRAPGPVLYIYPDENTARENSKDRIIPMIEESPHLNTYMTGSDDDAASLRIKLQHMPIYLAWARSASRLANKPIRYLIFDEIDKYPETAGKREADPISLGEKRATTYRGIRKIWKLSTPTMESAPIWQAFTKEAQVIFDFWVQCPFCDAEQLMVFENIKWPKEIRDAEKVESQNLARYECPHCESKWNDDDRNRAVRKGQWRARPFDWQQDKDWRAQDPGPTLFDYLKAHRPKKVGFHIPAWLSFFVGLSEVAAAFLKGLKNKQKLKDFNNAYKAEPWLDYSVERTEDAMLELCDDRPRGLVPGGDIIAGLTAAADTHKSEFVYEIRAWGWGFERDSWQIREGVAPTFGALEQIFWSDTYEDPDGNQYLIQMVFIDAMGAGRTAEVYDWCRLHRGKVFPIKGEQRMNQPFAYTKIDRYPGTNKLIPGGIQLVRINTTHYKNDLSNKLEIASGDPGSWRFHDDLHRQWALEMTAEYVDEKGLWQCPEGKANHAWDVSVYNLAAADVIGIKHRARPKPAKKPQSKTRRPRTPKNGKWIERREGWINKRT